MPGQSVRRWLVQTVATVCAITILSSLGAAVFASLCGGLGWLLGAEKAPIGLVWTTFSGAVAGFLLGSLWAIDRAVNWPHFLPRSPDEVPGVPSPGKNGEAAPIDGAQKSRI